MILLIFRWRNLKFLNLKVLTKASLSTCDGPKWELWHVYPNPSILLRYIYFNKMSSYQLLCKSRQLPSTSSGSAAAEVNHSLTYLKAWASYTISKIYFQFHCHLEKLSSYQRCLLDWKETSFRCWVPPDSSQHELASGGLGINPNN